MPEMLARLRFSWTLGAALAPLVATGCSYDSGHDYAVTVTWLINGTSPSEALCEAQGVDQVRFTVRSPSKRRTLTADCEDAIVSAYDGLLYGGVHTTVSFDYGVPYDYEVQMLDEQGQEIPELGYHDTFQVHFGDELPIELRPLELWDPKRAPIASIFASWSLDGAAPTSASCAALGADEVAIEIASATDAVFQDYIEIANAKCEEGELDTRQPVLGEGEYVVRYVLFSAENEPLQEIPLADGDALISFIVKEPGELAIDPVDFVTVP
jgi:hypothetical protein